ncbi:MAG TPA: hypothetical protein VJA21_10360 [Verrucomicrobiae bacterium]
MSSKLRKILLILLAAALFTGVSQIQRSLNTDRERLGLTRVEPLENAPPVLAFTTVALGGFRGLISNALWIRANDLQEQDKFFEMAQLADWITKLEPHFVQVWLVQAWNMAYNISVKFTDFSDRWRWVLRGVQLLRDDGLRYNPNEVLIYRELAWFFQHKIGANLDDANMHYKQQWANDIAEVFDKKKPNLDELIHPQTEDQQRRATLLRSKYKMDPEFMKQVDQRYGPLEWRLPESHAIYWAAVGLEKARENPTKVKADDLLTLRRVIYQSMLLSFQRGRLVENPFLKAFDFGPNLDIIPKVNAAYLQAAQEDPNNRDHILKAHRNFLKDVVYFLYMHNRMPDAAQWYQYLGKQYPDNILTFDTNSYPANVTLDNYCVDRTQEDVSEGMSRDRIRATIEGLLTTYCESLVLGEDDKAAGCYHMAEMIRTTYLSNTKARADALPMEPIPDILKVVLARMLDTERGLPLDARAVLRTKLQLGPEPPPVQASAATTNAVPDKVSPP